MSPKKYQRRPVAVVQEAPSLGSPSVLPAGPPQPSTTTASDSTYYRNWALYRYFKCRHCPEVIEGFGGLCCHDEAVHGTPFGTLFNLSLKAYTEWAVLDHQPYKIHTFKAHEVRNQVYCVGCMMDKVSKLAAAKKITLPWDELPTVVASDGRSAINIAELDRILGPNWQLECHVFGHSCLYEPCIVCCFANIHSHTRLHAGISVIYQAKNKTDQSTSGTRQLTACYFF